MGHFHRRRWTNSIEKPIGILGDAIFSLKRCFSHADVEPAIAGLVKGVSKQRANRQQQKRELTVQN